MVEVKLVIAVMMVELSKIKGFIIAGLLGSLTRSIHCMYKGEKSNKQIILGFILGILMLIPAFLIKQTFDLESDVSLFLGYIFGMLGERIIEYVLTKNEKILDTFINK